VRVAHGWQPGPDVDELPDAMLGYPLGRALVEPAVGPRTVFDLRHQLRDLLGRGPVGRETAGALQEIVVDPCGRWPARIHTRGHLLGSRHLSPSMKLFAHSLTRSA
jgi:hypothetical protein